METTLSVASSGILCAGASLCTYSGISKGFPTGFLGDPPITIPLPLTVLEDITDWWLEESDDDEEEASREGEDDITTHLLAYLQTRFLPFGS